MANQIQFKKNTTAPNPSTPSVIGQPLWHYAADGTAGALYIGWGGSNGNNIRVGALIEDSDTLGSGSDDKLATQGNIKTYVDNQVAAGDTTLANTKIWIGGAGGTKAEFPLSGDVSMTNGGVVTVSNAATVDTISGLAPNTAPTGTFILPSSAAAQPNITSVGTLTSLTTSGAMTSGDDFTVTGGMVCEAGGDTFFDGTVECGQLDCTGDVTIDGDLQINGTQTIVDSTVVSIADPVFEIGASDSDDNLDRGIKMKYNSSGAKIAFMGFDDSDGKFVMIANATDTSSVFSGTQATLKANLAGTVTLDGNTITGIDDSAEFTDDDAHIMTSAAVQDKILGYSYLDGNSNIGGGTYSVGA